MTETEKGFEKTMKYVKEPHVFWEFPKEPSCHFRDNLLDDSVTPQVAAPISLAIRPAYTYSMQIENWVLCLSR